MNKYIKKIVEKVLDKYLLPTTSFQDYVNTRYNREGYYVMNRRYLEGSYFVYEGLKFELNDQLDSFNSVMTDYYFDDIEKDDVVLDLGANVGVFSLLASQRAKHVFAVEPLFPDLLKRNLKINNIMNVTVLETGIGTGGTKQLEYGRRRSVVEVRELDEILERTGHCDFLKMDCEGCEWSILPSELKQFRRIEAEIHVWLAGTGYRRRIRAKKHSIIEFERVLKKAGFGYEMETQSPNYLIHAEKKR